MKRKAPKIPISPELLRRAAKRSAQRIEQYGWRPSKGDLAQLREATRDAAAYRVLAHAWRASGFKIRMIRKLAGRVSHSSAKALVPPSTII